jgi:hypothetical protein
MKIQTLDGFRATLKAQGVEREHYAFKCPMCGTVQSASSLIAAGVGPDFEAVEPKLGFSCVGRFTGKASPTEEKGKGHGCNWTLGGLFTLHTLEVVTPDGEYHPRFEPATAEEAAQLKASFTGAAKSHAVDVKVRMTGGTYIARHKGRNASNTAGPDLAAAALGRKIFGQLQRVAVERIGSDADRHNGIYRLTPDESQKCRECGCTFSRPCAGGCSWTEPDLCSTCATVEVL